MRVHLRGVVIAVGVLLLLVLVIALFNAFTSPRLHMRTRQLKGLKATEIAEDSIGDGSETDTTAARTKKPSIRARSSKISPRSSTRLRAMGPRMAGGTRPGGPRSSKLKGTVDEESIPARQQSLSGKQQVADLSERSETEGEDIDTESTDYEDSGVQENGESPTVPRGRARNAGRSVGGSRAKAASLETDDIMSDTDYTDEDLDGPSEVGPGRAKGAGGTPGRKRSGSRGRKSSDADTGEDVTTKPKEPEYPEWWKASYKKSAVYGLQDDFVGDQPLFPECPVFEDLQDSRIQRYGYVEPPNYMANSKNPCWFENTGKKDMLRCVPYFYVAGVAKCGATDLYHRIRYHPDVMKGTHSRYNWWDRLRYGASIIMRYTKEAKRLDTPIGLRDYAKMVVGDSGKNVTRELLYNGKSDSLFGDGSDTYLVENTQWDIFEGNEGCSEPRIIPATFIRHMFPDSRIIIILRHPASRLYSRFLTKVPEIEEFENATASLFHTFCAQAVQMYRECFNRASIRHCAYNASLFVNAVIRLSEGMYSIFLEDWFRIFPREHILILRYEDYVKDVQGNVENVFDFLGLDRLDEYNMLKISELPVEREGLTREEAGSLLPETLELLNTFYAPFLTRLAFMLDDKKWLFDDVIVT